MADTVFRQPDALEALVLKMGAVHNIIWIDGDTPQSVPQQTLTAKKIPAGKQKPTGTMKCLGVARSKSALQIY